MLAVFSTMACLKHKPRLQGWILLAWLGVWTPRAAAQGSGAELVTAGVGDTATLTATVPAGLLLFSWYRGTAALDDQLILSYVLSTSTPYSGPQSTGRESGLPDGSLRITGLRNRDTGNYTVIVTQSDGTPRTSNQQLRVYEPVTKPIVKYVDSQLVENRGLAHITCDTSSAAVNILWIFNGKPVVPGDSRVILSVDNRTLTITNVSQGDSGIYQCVAVNPVSNSTSDPQTLTIAYGPEDVKIDPPGTQWLQAGDKLSLYCTAVSVPLPQYQWLLNDTDLNRPGKTYTVEKVSSSRDIGNYTCVPHNTRTDLTVKASVFVDVNAGTDPLPAVSTCSCWQLTLAVACGVVLGAAVIVAGVVLYYKRRLNQKGTEKVVQNPENHYENMRKGHLGPPDKEAMSSDSAYMELKHGDQATYEKIIR